MASSFLYWPSSFPWQEGELMNGKMTNNKENLKREEQSLCVPFAQN